MTYGGVVVALHLYLVEQCPELNFRHQKSLKMSRLRRFCPTQACTIPGMVFRGQCFVLTSTWLGLEGGQGLTRGKESVKAIIKRHGGSVISELLLDQHSSDRGQLWPQESPQLP